MKFLKKTTKRMLSANPFPPPLLQWDNDDEEDIYECDAILEWDDKEAIDECNEDSNPTVIQEVLKVDKLMSIKNSLAVNKVVPCAFDEKNEDYSLYPSDIDHKIDEMIILAHNKKINKLKKQILELELQCKVNRMKSEYENNKVLMNYEWSWKHCNDSLMVKLMEQHNRIKEQNKVIDDIIDRPYKILADDKNVDKALATIEGAPLHGNAQNQIKWLLEKITKLQQSLLGNENNEQQNGNVFSSSSSSSSLLKNENEEFKKKERRPLSKQRKKKITRRIRKNVKEQLICIRQLKVNKSKGKGESYISSELSTVVSECVEEIGLIMDFLGRNFTYVN